MHRELEKFLRTSLQRVYINYQEWAHCNNIYHQFIRLNSSIYGLAYKSKFDSYLVIINKNLTLELQKEVFIHEIEHILYDMPDVGYIIGMDMQYSEIENKADNFAKAVMETAANYF